MRFRNTFFWAAALLLLSLMEIPVCFSENSRTPEPALATVNDVAIYPKELYQEMGQLKAEMDMRNRPLYDSQIEQLRSQLTENLIERELLYQHAQQRNIRIRSKWVNDALKELKDQLGSAAAMKTYLTSSGLTEQELETRIRKGLVVRRMLRREALRAIKVSEAEIQAFYREHPELFQQGEKIRVRHILAEVKDWKNPDQQAAALQKIQSFQNRIEQGTRFAVLALEFSDCPSRARGGDLGYLPLNEMVEAFSTAANALQPGEISDIVTTRFGYHLIQMVDREPPSIVNYREARGKIERTLRRNKENEAVANYIAALKRRANIVRHGSNP